MGATYGRLGDVLYLHGSSANSSIMAGNGREVCVTVTHLDGLVYARSWFHHSANYRSVVCYGPVRRVTDPDERLGENLLLRGRITARQYREASKLIRPGRRLGAILVELEAI